MAALAADRVTRFKGPESTRRRYAYQMAASTTIYKGAMVCLNGSRLAVPAADTAGFTDVVGIATAQQVSGASAPLFVVVERGQFLLDVGATITAADLEGNAYVTDDQTCCDGPQSTNKIRVGVIREYLDEAQDKAWVDVGNYRPLRCFVSAEITGTGASQNTAHGLGIVPIHVFASISEYAAGAIDWAPGAHTATNAVFTVTSGVKYYVIAMA